jgi:hypothetical protein
MSGGSYEYVAAFLEGNVSASGFESDPSILYGEKYFDKYPSESFTTDYKNRILGDATGEMGPFYYYADGDDGLRNHNGWYNDAAHFIYGGSAWVTRGGYRVDGVLAGQFQFGRLNGSEYPLNGFRLVLIG